MNFDQKFIYYVDDDEDDRELLIDTFQHAAPDVKLTTAQNGLEALTFLETVQKENKILPNLIVLDLNMPFLDGKATWERLRNNPDFKLLPVIIFSSGERPADKAFFERQGVPYLNKPIDLTKMKTIVGHMMELCKK